MRYRKLCRVGVICLLVALNIVLAFYYINLSRNNGTIRTAYLERAYVIYTKEIYPEIEGLDINKVQEAGALASDNIASFQRVLGLNSLCGKPVSELYLVSADGDTALYSYVTSMVDALYYIANPDYFISSPTVLARYEGLTNEELLRSVQMSCREIKEKLEGALNGGTKYIDAFESVEAGLKKAQ